MNPVNHTRSTCQPTHLLHTPDTFVRIALPGLTRGLAIIHAAPALGANFLQYTAELEPGGTLAPAPHQRFLYVLEGHGLISLDAENYAEGHPLTHPLHPRFFAYLPPAEPATITANTHLKLAVIEKAYEPLPGVPPPAAIFSQEDQIPTLPLNDDPNLLVRSLLPTTFDFDFAVNTMTYAPGAALPQVEVHVMEHGCLMLQGHGPYRLGDHTYLAQAGDFIWMAPFCPQWFQSEGPLDARYLIYKNWNRIPAL